MREYTALPEVVQRRALESPDREFLQLVDGESLTWRALQEGALDWARALSVAGVRHGSAVATMMPHGTSSYLAWLGCGWLGAVEVPIGLAYQGDWLRHAIDLPRATHLIVAERYLEKLVEVADELPWLRTVVVIDGGGDSVDLPFRVIGADEFARGFQADTDSGASVAFAPPQPRDVACIIYTSGTTGATKGVQVTWAMLEHAVECSVPDEWGPDDVWYGTAPLAHVSGKSCLLVAAHRDSRLVVRETYSTSAFWDDIRRYDCTGASLVGAMVNYLFRQPPRSADGDSPLRYVRMTPVIAEFDEFRQRFGVEIYSAYGITEFTPPIRLSIADVAAERWTTCGRARDGVELRVVDDDDRPLPAGEVGALVMRTDDPWLITPGYIGMPEETVAAWRNGWFHTNDAFTYDDEGFYYFQPDVKLKNMIRRRGENVSAEEVETTVRQHPAVAECRVVAVASEWGEDEVKVEIVPADGGNVDPAALIEYLVPKMPKFALPRFVEIVAALADTEGVIRRERAVGAHVWDRERELPPVTR